MTHRNPHVWYTKRKDFCKGPSHHKMCSLPFIMRPLDLSIRNTKSITASQSVQSFDGTEQLFKCLVDAKHNPEKYLQVGTWSPPSTILPISKRTSTISSYVYGSSNANNDTTTANNYIIQETTMNAMTMTRDQNGREFSSSSSSSSLSSFSCL